MAAPALDDNVTLPSAGEHGEYVTINKYVWDKIHFTALVTLCSFKIEELMKRVAKRDASKHSHESIAQKTLGELIDAVFKDSALAKSTQRLINLKTGLKSVNKLRNKVVHCNPECKTGLGSPLDVKIDEQVQSKQQARENEVKEMEKKKTKLVSDYKQAVEGLIPLLVILTNEQESGELHVNKLWESFEANPEDAEKINMVSKELNNLQAAQIKLYAMITADKTPGQPNKESKQKDCDEYAYLHKILDEVNEMVSQSIGNCQCLW